MFKSNQYILFIQLYLFLTDSRDHTFAFNQEDTNIGRLIPNKKIFQIKT